jgi:serine/threonine protein kinase
MPETEQFRIRDYQVEKAIARGGMATVYLATDLRSGRKVALKQILPHIAEDREFIERFRHEVRIHSQLRHPNILEILEFADGPTDYFIAMEYVDGGTLKFLLDRLRKFPTEIALFVTREVLRGLSAAHARGIIHRDIKPHNIMITRGGEVKVGDFGISKTDQMTRLTQTGELIGTPAYMSPEQASGHALDPRSDVFSSGVMLYEMLTGTNPFFTGNPATTIRKIVDFVPDGLFELDPTIPIECEALVNRLIAKNPELRFANAQTASEAVEARLQALGIGDGPALFSAFLQTPKQYVDERNDRLARTHLERGKKLIESGKASPEVALWELFQAQKVKGADDPEAAQLMATITQKTGYRFGEGDSENARIRALEEKLKEDPENLQVLLQLAKLYKLEKDFVNMMRFFLKLKSLDIEDAYLQGQVAALVALPGSAPPAPPPVDRPAGAKGVAAGKGAAAVARPAAPVAAPKLSDFKIPKPIVIGAAIAIVLVALGIRSAFRDSAVRSPEREPSGATAPEGIDTSKIQGDAGAVLERARKTAGLGDKASAIDILEKWIAKNPGHAELSTIRFELASYMDGLGRTDAALGELDKIIAAGGERVNEAHAARGDLLLRLSRDPEAEQSYRTLVDSGDARFVPIGRYHLGRIALNRNDVPGALGEFDSLISSFPAHDLASEARLEVARIRITEGNLDQAQWAATDAQRNSKVGGDLHRRAGELLKEIETKRGGAGSASPPPPPAPPATT